MADIEFNLCLKEPAPAPRRIGKVGVSNRNLHKAAKLDDDEFYTPDFVVEEGLRMIEGWLAGKAVYLNCDDHESSCFWKCLRSSFKKLGLKSLTCTGFKADGSKKKAAKAVYDGIHDFIYDLKGDGSFDSEECAGLAKESDIVITNPPFSLLTKGYWDFAISLKKRHGKDFFFLGPVHTVTYRKLLHFIQDDYLWTSGNIKPKFVKPDGSMSCICNVVWFSTLPIPGKPFEWSDAAISEYEIFEEQKNPNKILFVPEMIDIPRNYDGIMAVPLTYVQQEKGYFDLIKFGRIYRQKKSEGSSIGAWNESFIRAFIRRKPK
jgi:hypothetical protein